MVWASTLEALPHIPTTTMCQNKSERQLHFGVISKSEVLHFESSTEQPPEAMERWPSSPGVGQMWTSIAWLLPYTIVHQSSPFYLYTRPKQHAVEHFKQIAEFT